LVTSPHARKHCFPVTIGIDVRDYKPEYLGYNADKSDLREAWAYGNCYGNNTPWQISGATYNGGQMN